MSQIRPQVQGKEVVKVVHANDTCSLDPDDSRHTKGARRFT